MPRAKLIDIETDAQAEDPRNVLLATLLSIGVLVVGAYPIARRIRERNFDIFEPIFGGALMLAVLFGLRPLATIAAGDFGYRGLDTSPEFTFVASLGLIGTVAFVVAYEFVARRQNVLTAAPNKGDALPMNRTVAYGYAGALATLSLGLFALHLTRAGSLEAGVRALIGGKSDVLADAYANSSEYLSQSPILAVAAALVVAAATNWRPTKGRILVVAALLAYPVAVYFIGGDRRFMIPSIGVPIIAYALARDVRPRAIHLFAVVPIAFVLLVTIPFVRNAFNREQPGGLIGGFAYAIGRPGETVQRFILGPDTEMFSALTLEVRTLNRPEAFYYGRATIGDVLLAPIPHLLVPDKPQTARNGILVDTFGEPCSVGEKGLCPDFSAIGTFYQDLWVPGVALGMALLGLSSGVLWRGWIARPLRRNWIITTAAWVLFLPILIRAGFMPAFAWFLYFAVPTLAGTALATHLSQRGLSATSGLERQR
jgi:hypothetical protein